MAFSSCKRKCYYAGLMLHLFYFSSNLFHALFPFLFHFNSVYLSKFFLYFFSLTMSVLAKWNSERTRKNYSGAQLTFKLKHNTHWNSTAVSDLWWLPTVLHDQVILRGIIKIQNKIFILFNEQLFPNCQNFVVLWHVLTIYINSFHTMPVSVMGKKIWRSEWSPYSLHSYIFLMLMNERKRIIYVLRSIWRHI